MTESECLLPMHTLVLDRSTTVEISVMHVLDEIIGISSPHEMKPPLQCER
jgi:hypothetical protein